MDSNIYENNGLLGADDFVFTQKVGENGETEFIGGGYKVNSYFLNNGKSPMVTLNNEKNNQEGGKVSTPFENLAVPAGLFYINQRITKSNSDNNNNNKNYNKDLYKNHEMLPDDIYDKLVNLVEVDKKRKRKTRKFIKNHKYTNNKTQKQK